MTFLFSRRTSHRGFTLIELLLVIGIIAILAAIVIVAINPTKQLGDTRNAQRKVDINTILSAVWQYTIDKGTLPSTITTTPTIVCQSDLSAAGCTTIGGINLRMLSGTYVVSIPKDPLVTATATGTRYHISKDATSGRVTVAAPGAEQGATITASR